MIRSELAYFCAMRQCQNMTGGRVALVPARVVSERLGHSDVGVTLNVYGHVVEELQAETASAIESAVRPIAIELPG